MQGQVGKCLKIFLSIVALAFGATGPVYAAGAGRAYVSNSNENTVSVIDTSTDTVISSMNVGAHPEGVAVNASGTRVYVANGGDGTVSIIDTTKNAVSTITLPSGAQPLGIALNPNGTTLYVADNSSLGRLFVIDTANATVVETVAADSGTDKVAVNPAGNRVFVENASPSSDLNIFDSTTPTAPTLLKTVTLPGTFGASALAVHPSGAVLYVTNPDSAQVSVVDVSPSSTCTGSGCLLETLPLDVYPQGVAVNAAGTRLYVTNRCRQPDLGAPCSESSIWVYDTTNPAQPVKIDAITNGVGFAASDVEVAPDQVRLYLANTGTGGGHPGNTVSVFNIAGDADVPLPESPLTVGGFPNKIAFGPVPTVAPFVYVALGDSIVTGQSRQSCPSNDCDANNPTPATTPYPGRLKAKLQTIRPNVLLYNFSKSGATTVDVLMNQISNFDCGANAKPGKVCPDLVTLTVGADNFGLLDRHFIPTWALISAKKRQQLAAQLSVQLERAIVAMVQDIQSLAPHAGIVVMTDYPNPSDSQKCSVLAGVFDDIFYAGPQTGLNEAIQDAANQTGADFVDLYSRFTGHGIESSQNWFFGSYCGLSTGAPGLELLDIVRLALQFDPHPNAIGQQCIANSIWEQIKGGLGSTEGSNDPCPAQLTGN